MWRWVWSFGFKVNMYFRFFFGIKVMGVFLGEFFMGREINEVVFLVCFYLKWFVVYSFVEEVFFVGRGNFFRVRI